MVADFNIGQVFHEYKNKVYRLALSITRNQDDAEDILQNTFLKIFKNIGSFKGEANISTWIYKIAYNEALMYLRTRKSQFKLSGYLKRPVNKASSGLFVNWSKLPDEQLLDNEAKERVDAAIRQMPIQYRMALLLDNVERLPLKESARILNLKINSLKTRLHRARLMIKSDMENYFRDREGRKEGKEQKKCNLWMGFVYNYAHGNLGEEEGKAFRTHIKDCSGCNSFLDAYLKAIDITGALQCQDLPDELKNRIEVFVFKKTDKKY